MKLENLAFFLIPFLVLPILLIADEPAADAPKAENINTFEQLEAAMLEASAEHPRSHAEELAVKYLPVSKSHRFSRMGPTQDFQMMEVAESPKGTQTYVIRQYEKPISRFMAIPKEAKIRERNRWTVRYLVETKSLMVSVPDRVNGGKAFIPVERYEEAVNGES